MMRISFNECDKKEGDLFRCHDYDCYLNGKLFEKHWCLADEEKGEVQIFKKNGRGKIILDKTKNKVLREIFKGIVELKLKQGGSK